MQLSSFAAVTVTSVDFDDFEVWLLSRGLSVEWAKIIVRYVKKWVWVLESGNLREVEKAGKSKRGVLSALANLCRYRGVYSEFRRLKEECGIKWGESNSVEIFDKIWGNEIDGVESWLAECREKLPYRDWYPFKFMAETGVRTNESYRCLELVRKRGLGGYLNSNVGVLEHFRYPKLFFRNGKRVYLSVVDDEIIDELEQVKERTFYYRVWKILKKEGVKMRTYDLRKNWATFMVMEGGIPESIVDLLQGRVGASILRASYLRPDMKTMVEKVRRKLPSLRKKILV